MYFWREVMNRFLPDQFTSSDDKDEAESKAVVQALEHIDDDCDRLLLVIIKSESRSKNPFKLPYKSQYNTPIFSSRVGIMLVKIDDAATATEYGVEDTPALVYFENEVPHLYEGKKDIS